jgi:hypothetical protein
VWGEGETALALRAKFTSVMTHLLPEEILRGLGESMGIPGLRADGQGCCRLMFEPDMSVEIRPVGEQGRWLLACTVRSLRVVSTEAQALLLKGNLLGAGFGGGWAALDEQGSMVVHLPLPASEVTSSALVAAIEALLDLSERWAERLKRASLSPRAADDGLMAAFAQRI